MNLAESSLAGEATNYDFTASVTIGNTDYYQRIFGVTSQRLKPAVRTNNLDVTIESNEVNKHDCMVAFVASLKKLIVLSESVRFL